MILFGVYCVFYFRQIILRPVFIFCTTVILLATLMLRFGDDLLVVVQRKVSSEYFTILFHDKLNRFLTIFDLKADAFLWGSALQNIGGDFAFLNFLLYNGLTGFLFLVLFVLANQTSRNFFPTSLLILSSLHYGSMFFIPGQVVFGLLLSRWHRSSRGPV